MERKSEDVIASELRIAKRRERIEQQKTLKNKNSKSRNQNGQDGVKLSRGKQQVVDSLGQLDRRKLNGIESVTSVRVEVDNRETNRRMEEENRRARRLSLLQEEAITSSKRNAAVEMRWSELSEYHMPKELHGEIMSQKKACDEILESKDSIILECQKQLKHKDEEYVKTLKSQSEDIEKMIEHMSGQFKGMQEEYGVELEQIETAFLKEREELLARNKSEIDSLFEQRRATEMAYMEAKQARDEQYQSEIEQLRVQDAEDYTKLKIKLETDIQTLEQQLEEMRATYQLNTEKLEYNYRVLTERDMENSATLSQQKRKLTRLKDALTGLMQKYNAADQRDRNVNQELTDEYRRLTKQYKDLQSKFRHFEVADTKKYHQVWNMHEEETALMVHKLLKADKIIHEQQLGLTWVPPTMSLSEPQGYESRILSKGDASAAEAKQQSELNSSVLNSSESNSTIPSCNLNTMLEMLTSEAGFLLDSKVLHAIDNLDHDEAELVRADNILRSLGVINENDMEKLASHFFHPPITPGDDDLGNTSKARMLKITPDQVVSTISAFVKELEEERKNESNGQLAPIRALEDSGQVAEQIRKRKIRHEEKECWKSFQQAIPDATLRVYATLEESLVKYNTILESRSNTIEQVTNLEKQNAELKSLLRQYLGSQVNDQLLIPPSQTIKVKPPQL